MGNEWRKIDGWPYEVSDHGEVRRTDRAPGTRPGLLLKPERDRWGYLKVGLRRTGERQRKFLIHVLVAEAFLGMRPEGFTVNHRNGDKQDNRVGNLEWTTRSENQKHAYRTGLQGRGQDHGRAKLTDEQVLEIRRRYAVGDVSQRALATQYGVNQTLIGFIVRRVVWTHI